MLNQGILKGEVSLYGWPPVWLAWNQLYDNWQFLFLFAKQVMQTGGQQHSDTSPFSIPWLNICQNLAVFNAHFGEFWEYHPEPYP